MVKRGQATLNFKVACPFSIKPALILMLSAPRLKSRLVGDWKEYLIKPEIEGILDDIRKRNLSGLPLGEDSFLESLAVKFGIKPEDLKPKPMCPGF